MAHIPDIVVHGVRLFLLGRQPGENEGKMDIQHLHGIPVKWNMARSGMEFLVMGSDSCHAVLERVRRRTA